MPTNSFSYYLKMNSIPDIYDHLFSFESKRKKLSHYPVHKKLSNGDQFDDPLINLMFEKIKFRDNEKILDAGCGTGDTLFQIVEKHSIQGIGISLSSKEIEFAEKLANANKLANLRFKVYDFQQPIEGSFDKILAIESLKHASNIDQVISNFHKALKKEGQIFIADDFLMHDSIKVERHKLLWNASGFMKFGELEEKLKTLNYNLRAYDLTSHVRCRSNLMIEAFKVFINILKPIASKNLKVNLETYYGALLLEQLYNENTVEYKVIIATKS